MLEDKSNTKKLQEKKKTDIGIDQEVIRNIL